MLSRSGLVLAELWYAATDIACYCVSTSSNNPPTTMGIRPFV